MLNPSRVLLFSAPMVQINTPYPATAYLAGFLRRRGWQVDQVDLSLELALKVFSSAGLQELGAPPEYAQLVDAVVEFLQGRNPTLATRIVTRTFLPEGPRFANVRDAGDLDLAFGGLGTQDRARYLASLFLDDLGDWVRAEVDPCFEFVRYGEKLAASQPSFDGLAHELAEPRSTPLRRWLAELVEAAMVRAKPDVVGISSPFSGSVLGALLAAIEVKRVNPKTHVLWGGGYVNTELRSLEDQRVFQFVDAVIFDDGEGPVARYLEWREGKAQESDLFRTQRKGVPRREAGPTDPEPAPRELARPDYSGLRLGEYLGLLEMLNPVTRLWTEFRWNKLTAALGCYWKRCTFCDTSLPYIRAYAPQSAKDLVDRMEEQVRTTGVRGFHLVDEAAPPALLRAMAEEIVRRGLVVTWWGNIRFEKTFTPELCEVLAKSGCIAVTGGLEVASDRLLKLIDKGVSVEQVARVTRAFADAGVMTHAYLMYGFPSQTLQETVDSLEMVRQLFAEGCLHSAFWHRFSVTVHSEVGRDPQRFGIRLAPPQRPATGWFAQNDVRFVDSVKTDHDALGAGLKRAVYNFMLGAGLDHDVRSWFVELKTVPKARVAAEFISSAWSDPVKSAKPNSDPKARPSSRRPKSTKRRSPKSKAARQKR